jgi:hypothetical protein
MYILNASQVFSMSQIVLHDIGITSSKPEQLLYLHTGGSPKLLLLLADLVMTIWGFYVKQRCVSIPYLS